jgi:hypothetical protein
MQAVKRYSHSYPKPRLTKSSMNTRSSESNGKHDHPPKVIFEELARGRKQSYSQNQSEESSGTSGPSSVDTAPMPGGFQEYLWR